MELAVQRVYRDYRSDVEQIMERHSREKTEFDFHHRLLMPDGSVKYLRIVGRRAGDESGRLEFVGAGTDITESKRAEDDVRAGEKTIKLNGHGIAGLVTKHSQEGRVEVVTSDTHER